MKITAVSSFPVVMILMTVEKVVVSGRESHATDADGFDVYLPCKIVKKVANGDVLHVLCIPDEGLRIARKVLLVSIQKCNSGIVVPLFKVKGELWTELYRSFAFLR
jgi:hypothetical protein